MRCKYFVKYLNMFGALKYVSDKLPGGGFLLQYEEFVFLILKNNIPEKLSHINISVADFKVKQ